MTIKLELLKNYISDVINARYSDFDAIEAIVSVFEKYKIDFGIRHDWS